MIEKRVKPRIAEYDLKTRPGGGVAGESGVYLFRRFFKSIAFPIYVRLSVAARDRFTALSEPERKI